MIGLYYNNLTQKADFKFTGKTLWLDDTLETAVFISLHTDRRANPGEHGYSPDKWNRGWWADTFARDNDEVLGSLLWTLEGAKIDAFSIRLAKEFCEDALRWMVNRGVAKRSDVTSEQRTESSIGGQVQIIRPDGSKFTTVWEKTLL